MKTVSNGYVMGHDGQEYRLDIWLDDHAGTNWVWSSPGGPDCLGWTAETSRAKALLEAEYQLREKTSK